MSIEAINEVAKMDIRPSGRKFVALALANFADENWSCFPSARKIGAWTSQGERSVRRHLEDLEASGFLVRNRVRREDGSLGVYRYFIQRPNWPAAKLASGQKRHLPAANLAAHNHKINHQEIYKNARARENGFLMDELERVIDAERAEAVIEHRKALRKPLTVRAAKLLAGRFAKCPDPNAAADAMIANGWQSFDSAWLQKQTAPPRNPGTRRRTAGDLMRELWEQENGSQGEEIHSGNVVSLSANARR